MSKHRIVFVGLWAALLCMLVLVPGFETRGLAMGLIIGAWPFFFIPWHAVHPIVAFIIMLVLSGATVWICAWIMDKARMTPILWGLLFISIIAGSAFLSRNNISYEEWQHTPSVSAAMESPEVNYHPSRADYHAEIVTPKALAGCMLGLYGAMGVCFVHSAGVLMVRRYAMRKKQNPVITN